MMRTSKNQQQTRKLTLGKVTLRILGQAEISRVNGGSYNLTVSVCITTQDYPCPNPGFATTMC